MVFLACSQQCPNSLPQLFPKCFTHVPNVYHKYPKCCRASLTCVSNISLSRSQSVPDSVLQMLQKRFKSVLFLFQACSDNVSVSNVCQWWFNNFLKCAQSVPNCPKLVPQVLQTCLNMCQEASAMLPWCFKVVSTVSQTCSQHVHNSSPTVPHKCSKNHSKFSVHYCCKHIPKHPSSLVGVVLV